MDIDEIKQEVSDITHEFDRKVAMQVIDYLHSRGYLGGVAEWQPIETAPKDGTYVLTLSDWGANEAFWNGYTWITAIQSGSDEYAPLCCKPTAWMPLPSADGGE